MVVYTPRLCDDVAFLPPREDRANGVQCRQIMDPEAMEEFYTQKAKREQAEALDMLRKAARTALGLEGLGVGEAEAEVVGGKKAEGKKKSGKKIEVVLKKKIEVGEKKKIEVGEKKTGGKKDKVADKKTDKTLDQIVFVEVDEFDDYTMDEEEGDGEEEEERLHQEL